MVGGNMYLGVDLAFEFHMKLIPEPVRAAYIGLLMESISERFEAGFITMWDTQKEMIFVLNVDNGVAVHLYMQPNTFWMDRARLLFTLVPTNEPVERWIKQ